MSTSFSGLSAKQRTTYLQEMSQKQLDLLVVGGGITGAGIAWDAASREMLVGLLEMNDFASGTSSRSTKLIHGGLRYLKQGEIGLVREVGQERDLLHRSAPHLVEPIPMLLPVYKRGTYSYLASSIGLYLYDKLAGVKPQERRKMFRREETLSLEPLFRKEGLKGSGYYYEYRTDDARLTMEVMKSARAKGAIVASYAKVMEFIYRGGKVIGVRAMDRMSGKNYEIFAKVIVNAAGPWVDQVRQMDQSLHGKRLLLTKGIHLVVDHTKLPISQAAYFDVPGGRMIFAIPRDGKTYIGTTDTVYEGALETPGITDEDRRYLIDAVNAAFPDAVLGVHDIESGWAGIRPLVREEGKNPSEVSRKDELFSSDSGLITIAGGKLTGFRKMAERVVNMVAKHFQDTNGAIYPPCTTNRAHISGGDMEGLSLHQFQEILTKQGRMLGIQSNDILKLISRYGANTKEILRIFRVVPREETTELTLLRAEISYSIEHEMTLTALDFLLRRTGWVLFDRQRTERCAVPLMEMMGEMLDWNSEEKQRQWMILQDLLEMTWGIAESSRSEGDSRYFDHEDRHDELMAREKPHDDSIISATHS
ncbi:glycerol-3-phosphate dehydrogenase [Paenibacillus sp. JCM 10914]|uniref:glycerol-3-phosphate dehydrogenase/oxidase n=1 Tax=Paenibacillus sp. JCM 10914 TaxID=1236974 RepID=UPI0003CC504E|nr:glycerol-3-phosphate dehydrogenase/oxidase [Paenibacillus sp. JCM 10914]GAE07878.1 aerobic glycerol-3-phosphate dehydrogenase [Paenibacillus sp. JCM 10914]